MNGVYFFTLFLFLLQLNFYWNFAFWYRSVKILTFLFIFNRAWSLHVKNLHLHITWRKQLFHNATDLAQNNSSFRMFSSSLKHCFFFFNIFKDLSKSGRKVSLVFVLWFSYPTFWWNLAFWCCSEKSWSFCLVWGGFGLT